MKLFRANSYCNPDDPRDFIFASSTNDRLGALPNLARGRAKRVCRQFAIPFALVLLPCLLLYLYNRAFYPLFLAVFFGGLWIRSRYFKRLAKEELADARALREELITKIRLLLLPKDPNDQKNVIFEIRSGVGGEESALFASDLYRMYAMYAEQRGWKIEIANVNETELGGIKEIDFIIEGEGAYSRLKYESGVHRVQRVPETESQGRIHTSAATVVVMPEVEDVEVDINENDIRIDIFRSGGAGGQNVNKVSSAIRMTHIPTGIVVQCQDERSQLKNKEKAMRILKSRLFDLYQSKQNAELANTRKSMVGSGDRSERVRTYNFPQNRVTDHRITLTLYKLEQFLDGDMDEMIDALILADRAQQLSEG